MTYQAVKLDRSSRSTIKLLDQVEHTASSQLTQLVQLKKQGLFEVISDIQNYEEAQSSSATIEVGGVLDEVGDSSSSELEKMTPPLLIGGVKHTYTEQAGSKAPNISLSGVGIDYLTVTVPQATAESLLARTSEDEPGRGSQGFKQTEKRMCLGGYCWRKWNPVSSSKRWGTEYETWEFSGAASFDPARFLQDKECRPSRIDIAFDYDVDADFYPVALESMIEAHVDLIGAKIRYAGERKKQTLYIGSMKSDRMIRIYRRDEKNPLLALEGRHILRVELVLKGDHAEAIWNVMRQDRSDGYPEAAAHVLAMIGYAPCEDVSSVPQLLRTDEDTEAVQMLLQFVTQNAIMLEALDICDVDLRSVVKAKIHTTRNRLQKMKLGRRVRVFENVDSGRLTRQVVALMGQRS